MFQAPTNPLTITTFLALPETKPASEFIDGKIIQKPIPQGKHSALQSDLMALINSAARTKRLARAFLELRCTFAGSAIVPDLAVFVWERIQRNDGGEIANVFAIAPDWTIEILSPGQRITPVTKKILRCLKHGTQMGWLIAPADKAVHVYRPQQAIEILDESDAVLPMPNFVADLTVTTAELFALSLL